MKNSRKNPKGFIAKGPHLYPFTSFFFRHSNWRPLAISEQNFSSIGHNVTKMTKEFQGWERASDPLFPFCNYFYKGHFKWSPWMAAHIFRTIARKAWPEKTGKKASHTHTSRNKQTKAYSFRPVIPRDGHGADTYTDRWGARYS